MIHQLETITGLNKTMLLESKEEKFNPVSQILNYKDLIH